MHLSIYQIQLLVIPLHAYSLVCGLCKIFLSLFMMCIFDDTHSICNFKYIGGIFYSTKLIYSISVAFFIFSFKNKCINLSHFNRAPSITR